jgi:multiple sugar transport system substrate-binding protein
MKKFKKVISVFIACIMCASMFSGCGSENTEGLKEVQVWSHNSHSKELMNEKVDEFNKTKGKDLGVKIVYTVREGDIQQAAEMAYASEQGPDFISQIDLEKNRVAGNIYAIDDIKGGKEWIESTYDSSIYDTKSFKGNDGKVYRLPFSVNTFGLVYNKDMFKKYGIVDENGEPTPPKTFEEMREYAKRMTNPEDEDYGIIVPMKWGGFISTDVVQLLYSSTGMGAFDCLKGEYDFTGLKPILEMYKGMIDDGSVFPGAESLDNDMARAYFAERNIGMKFAGSYDVGVFNSQFKAKCDWGVAPYPVADDNNRYRQFMTMGGGFTVSSKAIEKFGDEVCLEILKFLYSDELNKSLYEAGMAIPYDAEITQDANVADGLKGWEEFRDMVSIGTIGYDTANLDITGQKNHSKVIMEDVFPGNVSIDDAIADLNKRYNEGMYKYYENNTDKDIKSFVKTEWDTSLN